LELHIYALMVAATTAIYSGDIVITGICFVVCEYLIWGINFLSDHKE